MKRIRILQCVITGFLTCAVLLLGANIMSFGWWASFRGRPIAKFVVTGHFTSGKAGLTIIRFDNDGIAEEYDSFARIVSTQSQGSSFQREISIYLAGVKQYWLEFPIHKQTSFDVDLLTYGDLQSAILKRSFSYRMISLQVGVWAIVLVMAFAGLLTLYLLNCVRFALIRKTGDVNSPLKKSLTPVA